MFRVVERGCRFAEIDAVLRNVRFFFLGIPLKSHYPLHIGAVWDDVNIELQYNLVGIWLSTGEFNDSTKPYNFLRFNGSTIQRFTWRQPALYERGSSARQSWQCKMGLGVHSFLAPHNSSSFLYTSQVSAVSKRIVENMSPR